MRQELEEGSQDALVRRVRTRYLCKTVSKDPRQLGCLGSFSAHLPAWSGGLGRAQARSGLFKAKHLFESGACGILRTKAPQERRRGGGCSGRSPIWRQIPADRRIPSVWRPVHYRNRAASRRARGLLWRPGGWRKSGGTKAAHFRPCPSAWRL